jgi:hypothetical protein
LLGGTRAPTASHENKAPGVVHLGRLADIESWMFPSSTATLVTAAAGKGRTAAAIEHATVLGYAPDLSLVTLREGSNGMVCTASRPGDAEFDVRCYHQSFMPVVRRMRDLHSRGVKEEEIYRTIDAEVKVKKLAIPDHPVAGYRTLGPISAYRTTTNTVGPEIQSWQSVHFPYKTAGEIGLPEEGQVSPTMPYVMASGTFWSHVMIEHENALAQK